MTVSIESLGIDRLSVQELLQLIEQIWDSLPDSLEPEEIPEWHPVALARRRAEAEANPGGGKPWRGVLASVEIQA